MIDRREAILARVLAIAEALPGIKNAERNKNDYSDLSRPAIVILDGDEEPNSSDPESRPSDAPRIVHMKPEIVILRSGEQSTVGSEANATRAALYKALTTDTELIGLVLDGTKRQSIRYFGAELSIASGRAIEATMKVHFQFTYALRSDEL